MKYIITFVCFFFITSCSNSPVRNESPWTKGISEKYKDNHISAISYFKSANLSNSSVYELSASQYELGWYYYEGQYVEQNLYQAVDWWKKSSENGNKSAKKQLKSLLSGGTYTPLGANVTYRGYNKIINDIETNELHIIQRELLPLPKYLTDVEVYDNENYAFVPDCVSGQFNTIEVQGVINYDTFDILEKIISNLEPCVNKEDEEYSTIVYLDSSGGALYDGYKIGNLFNYYNVQARIIDGQSCASSCAIAFLGAKNRLMESGSNIIFHAPYTISENKVTINCSYEKINNQLNEYYNKMIGNYNGNILYHRTMSYCTNTGGWTINADAARLFGITNF